MHLSEPWTGTFIYQCKQTRPSILPCFLLSFPAPKLSCDICESCDPESGTERENCLGKLWRKTCCSLQRVQGCSDVRVFSFSSHRLLWRVSFLFEQAVFKSPASTNDSCHTCTTTKHLPWFQNVITVLKLNASNKLAKGVFVWLLCGFY